MNEQPIATYTDLPRVPVREAEEQATALLAVLDGWELQSAEDLENAGGLLKEVHGQLKSLDDLRLEVGRPAREAQRDINAFFAPAIKAFGRAKDQLKSKIDDHRRRVAEQNKVALAELSKGQPAAMIPRVEVPHTSTRREVDIRIVDIELIPREYLCVDWSALKILAKAGGTAPPGVEFVFEERTVVK